MYNEKSFENFMLKNILNETELNYINKKTKKIDVDELKNLDLFGCFLIIKDDKIVDFKVLVPKIKNLKSMLINIHEYTHATLIYRHIYDNQELDESETLPKNNEKIYLNKIKKHQGVNS